MGRLDPNKVYTREALTGTEEGPAGFDVLVCKLCGDRSLEDGDLIVHKQSCPFAWEAVLAIKGVALTAPREDICEQCPGCPAGSWKTCTHEELMTQCSRYVVDNGRILDPVRRPK